MKFIVDNQLPWSLARWLSSKGHDAVHVLDRDQGQVADHALWEDAIAEGRIMVSKDADFFLFAMRPDDRGKLLWLRVGNCRRNTLFATMENVWLAVEEAFKNGQRVVEVR